MSRRTTRHSMTGQFGVVPHPGARDVAAVHMRWFILERGALTAVLVLSLTTGAGASDAAHFVQQIVAHGGASAECPTNTLRSIRRGIAVGASAVEVDVRRTKDGELVLLHDATVDRTTNGTGAVRDLTLAEIKALDAGAWFDPSFRGERVPTLREALELCRGQIDLILDLKERDPSCLEQVARTVREHGDPRRTAFGVRRVAQARLFRDRVPEASQLGLVESKEVIAAYIDAGVETIRLRRHWLADDAVVAQLRKRGVKLLVNGMKGTLEDVRDVLPARPDAVATDDPVMLRSTLAAIRAHDATNEQVIAPDDSAAAPPRSEKSARAVRHRAAHRRRRIIVNNDGNDCVAPTPDEPRTRDQFLGKRTAPLVGSHVDTISYCTGPFNLYTHHSRESELRKQGTKGAEDWAWRMGLDGPDALATMIRFGHRHDIEVFWSMRMNDTHDAKYAAAMSKWKRDHPQYLMGTKGEKFPYGRARWSGRWSALDYAIPEVRDKAFAILRDVATRYDVDGLELDFFRHPVYFRPQMTGQPVTQAHCDRMTGLLRRVRAMTEAVAFGRGRPVLLAVRLPDSVDYAKAIGLDVVRWLEEDLVDLVIGGGYFHLEPWERLVALGRRFDTPVYSCLSASRLGFPAEDSDRFARRKVVGPEVWRGEALRAWDAGVSGIYVFNCFDPRAGIFRELGAPQVLRTLDRTYQADPGPIDHWLKGGDAYIRLEFEPPDESGR